MRDVLPLYVFSIAFSKCLETGLVGREMSRRKCYGKTHCGLLMSLKRMQYKLNATKTIRDFDYLKLKVMDRVLVELILAHILTEERKNIRKHYKGKKSLYAGVKYDL
jgi:hypothetical protein